MRLASWVRNRVGREGVDLEIQVKFGGNANGDAIMCSIKIIGRVGYEDVRTWGRVKKCKWWRMVFHMEIAGRKRRWTTRGNS